MSAYINKKIKSDVAAACKLAIERAMASGCTEAKVVCSVERDQRISCEQGEFTLANVINSQNLAIYTLKNQRKGTASINSLERDDIVHAVQQAIELGSFSIPDSNLGLIDAKLANKTKIKPLKFLHNTKTAKLDLLNLKKIAAQGLKYLNKDKRLSIDRYDVAVGESYYYLLTSHGVERSESQCSLDWDYLAMATQGSKVGGMDYGGSFLYDLKSLNRVLRKDCEDFSKRVIANLGARKCPTYKSDVVLLSPRAIEELLLKTVLYHMSGSQIMDGKSKWANALNKKVCSTKLTMRDDPFHREMNGTSAFDGDGMATRSRIFIDQGKLCEFLLDAYSARKLELQPNATNGGPFNLMIEAGKRSLKQILKEHKQLLCVDRFSGNIDPLTGDFSGVAKNSALYKSGKRAFAVNETMIAGNVFTLITDILELSRDTLNVGGSYIAPYILVKGVKVS